MVEVHIPIPEDYLWMVIAGGIACGTMGIGIGANDVANNFGSSIGSGAIRFLYAVLIAAVFEMVGAIAFGATVTESVRNGVLLTDHGYFSENPIMLMFGNFCALIAGTIWLLGCSATGLPVSTTHTIIGTLFGVGLATGDMDIIDFKYIGTVVVSWVTSPLLASILAACLFALTRSLILRSDNAIKRVGIALYLCTFVLVSVFSMFFIFKNPLLKSWYKESYGRAIGVGLAIGFLGMIVLTPLFNWLAHNSSFKGQEGPHPLPLSYRMLGFPSLLRNTHEEKEYLRCKYPEGKGPNRPPAQITADLEAQAVPECSSCSHPSKSKSSSSYSSSQEAAPEALQVPKQSFVRLDKTGRVMCSSCGTKGVFEDADDSSDLEVSIEEDCNAALKRKWYSMPWFMDLHRDAMREDLIAAAQQDNAEMFPSNVEKYFAALQILSAIVSCIVHGSNDVANAVAPFATVYGMYTTGGLAEKFETPVWILALGGSSIALGVLFLGHKVIQAVGMKLIKMTPSRGFCVELGMASIMVIGSVSGLPLSTTHCQVGATIGVGIIDRYQGMPKSKRNCMGFFNTKAVNGKLIIKILVAWVATLVFSAAVAGALFAFGAYAPHVVEYEPTL